MARFQKKKGTRAGGKFTGSHSTIIPAAECIADIAHDCVEVNRIVLGYIKAGLPPSKGLRIVKMKIDGANLLLSVRDNTSHQELHVYGDGLESIKKYIALKAKKERFKVVE